MEIRDVVSRILAAEPHGIHGTFSTQFRTGEDGERGSFLFHDSERWAVDIQGAALLWSNGTRQFVRNSSGTSSGKTRALPGRPPWSMVIPRLAYIFGRDDDDWSIGAVSVTGDVISASLVAGEFQGRAVFDLGQGVIRVIETPAWTATVDPGLPDGEEDRLRRVLEAGLA